jgi:ankyrin repeat protein
VSVLPWQRKPPAPEMDKSGRYPGWYDAMEGRAAALRKALATGLHPDHSGKDSMTMVAVAAHYGQRACVELLLAKGADPNLVDRHGNGPLWHATREASKKPLPGKVPFDTTVVHLLLEAGADPAHPNKAGTVPALWAQWSEELQGYYRRAGYQGDFVL